MEAGYGAEEQASRRARRAAERRREIAAGQAAGSAVEAELARALQQQRAWAQGAEGERQVAAALRPLGQFGWVALHDVHWPGRPQANIDHIAVGPGGVVVIDAKNWTGAVTLANGTLRQNGYSREREVEGVAQAAAAVTALLPPQHRAATRAVICLAGQDQAPVDVGPGVTVVGRFQLAAWLATLPARLHPCEVPDLGRHLYRLLAEPRSPGTVRRRPGPARPGQRSGPATPYALPAPGRAPTPRRRSVLVGCGAVIAVFVLVVVVLALVSTIVGELAQ